MKMLKWGLPIGRLVSIEMPRCSLVRHVHEQHGSVVIWAECPDNGEMITRQFQVFGTGWPIEPMPGMSAVYRGTAHVGAFVWHVYEYVAPDGL